MSPLFSNWFIVALVVPPRKIVFGSRRTDSSVKSISATDVMFFRKEGLTILLAIFLSKHSIDDFNLCNVGSSCWSSKLKFVKIEVVAWVNKNVGSSKGSLNHSFNLWKCPSNVHIKSKISNLDIFSRLLLCIFLMTSSTQKDVSKQLNSWSEKSKYSNNFPLCFVCHVCIAVHLIWKAVHEALNVFFPKAAWQ